MDQIPVRPAATIVVIRERNELLEILMLRRSARATAASGAYVFPGGGVDDADDQVASQGLVSGRDAVDADRRLDLDDGALTYYCAALRELFEEAGLLLASDAAGRPLEFADDRLEAWREELSSRRVGWAELLEREGLRLSLDRVHYVAHWVTPAGRPHRFDTRFFLAGAPLGQVVRPDGREITEHVWTTASEALRRSEASEWTMLVPTVHTLRSLVPMRSVDEVVAYASTLRVQRTQPREIERDGRIVVVIPGEPGYEA